MHVYAPAAGGTALGRGQPEMEVDVADQAREQKPQARDRKSVV